MGTAHKKTDTGAIDAEITEDDIHPTRSFDTPTGRYRMGAIHFLTAANGENVIAGLAAGTTTYNFVNVLPGAPGAGVVNVKVQGTMDLTVRKLAQAIAGVTDAVNIEYGAGTKPNPDVLGFYTSQRLSVGAAPLAAGSNMLFVEKVADQTDTLKALTLTTTTVGSTAIVFIREYVTRYLMTGNAVALGDRVAGAYQMLIPMNSVMDDSGNLVYYDPAIFVSEAVSLTTIIIECDSYWSSDEVTFTLMGLGLDVSKELITTGASQFKMGVQRIPPGAGFYVKMRSSGTVITDWIDFKIHTHYYPLGV